MIPRGYASGHLFQLCHLGAFRDIEQRLAKRYRLPAGRVTYAARDRLFDKDVGQKGQ